MKFDLAGEVELAEDGALVRIPPGSYAANLAISRSVTLLAMGPVQVNGRGRGSVVRIQGRSSVVKLCGLSLVNGLAECGGGVALFEGKLEMRECTLQGNKAPFFGGGALYLREGRAEVTACRFEGNTGQQGGAILVDGLGELLLRDSLLSQNAAVQGGALRVEEGARAELLGCTIADHRVVGTDAEGAALHATGTMTRKPEVKLTNCILAGHVTGPRLIFNHGRYPALLELRRCLLPKGEEALGGDNLFGEAGFTYAQQEPYTITPLSPAVGSADATAYGAGAKDLLGRRRIRDGKADIGAFAALP